MTLVPSAKPALQVAPHVMPAGALVTVPEPFPVREIVKVRVGGGGDGLAKRKMAPPLPDS